MPPENVPVQSKEPKRKRALWSAMCPNLAIEEVYEELPAEFQIDSDGNPLVKMGTEQAEELVYTPGHCHIRRITRQRYGRSDTAEKVTIAPAPVTLSDT